LRKLASIQRVTSVSPIPDADRIEAAQILGWQVVIRKGELKPGDLCVYFEIDSVLPFGDWNEFLRNKDKPDKPIRLKTQRFRGQISQGLAMPLNVLPLENRDWQEGDDVTSLLRVEKYEPPIPAQLSGQVCSGRPSYAPMTDEQRIQSEPGLIDEFKGHEVYITQKIHGTSATFAHCDGEFHVCGRNWCYYESEKNTYWQVFKSYNLEEKLKRAGNYVVQGEIAGPGINENWLKLKHHQLFVFNVIEVAGRRYLDFEEFKQFCSDYELPTVPVIQIVSFEFDMDELLEMAKGKYASGKPQEGIVIRPTKEFMSRVLGGRASFKVINNDFLLKGGH